MEIHELMEIMKIRENIKYLSLLIKMFVTKVVLSAGSGSIMRKLKRIIIMLWWLRR